MTYKDDIDILKWLGISSRLYSVKLDKELKKYNLNSSLYYYIVKIYANPGITQEKLSNLVYLNPSNITRAINQLIKLDYIKKSENKTDKRTSILNLTKKGKEIYPSILDTINSVQKELLDVIEENEQELFIEQIKKIALKATKL